MRPLLDASADTADGLLDFLIPVPFSWPTVDRSFVLIVSLGGFGDLLSFADCFESFLVYGTESSPRNSRVVVELLYMYYYLECTNYALVLYESVFYY